MAKALPHRPLLPGLQTIAEREAALLAPYAMHSADSRGRKHPEDEHPYRGPFQRDRDRILHSSAYRRMSGKMQVFTGAMGDYHRTRLTHTQEVASIARTIGRALRLNEDLIEALALFHDIGHPPFGHAGEDALDECLVDEGGFSHNRYALTIAEELEQQYPRFPGLNLTLEVLAGQIERAEKAAIVSAGGATPLLEVQVVDAADSMTYDAHDVDDAVKLGLVALDELAAIPLVQDCVQSVERTCGHLDAKRLRKAVVHELIDRQVGDLLQCTGAGLRDQNLRSAAAARTAGFRIVPSREIAQRKSELEAFLHHRVYRNRRLIAMREEAQRRLRAMFIGYRQRVELLPAKFRARAESVGLPRAIVDYLAGMTDRYCDQQFQEYFA